MWLLAGDAFVDRVPPGGQATVISMRAVEAEAELRAR